MSSSKRRKLDITPKKPPLSAFAARKALQTAAASPQGQLPEGPGSLASSSEPSNVDDKGASPSVRQQLPLKVYEHGQPSNLSESQAASDKSDPSSSFGSRPPSPEIKPRSDFSSFKPSKSNFKELQDGSVRLKLAPGERLVILGQYELSVNKGRVTILGSTLQASEISYPIYALSAQSLPAIRCLATDINAAEIKIGQYHSGFEKLGPLSPLFANLGNIDNASLGTQYQNLLSNPVQSTFQILFTSEDFSQMSYAQTIMSAPEWNAVLAKCSAGLDTDKSPIIIICGPKSSGKSTYAKLLTNRLLLSLDDASTKSASPRRTGVALLDIDPGQPEFFPPGQLGLFHINEPNFGPPFSHPLQGIMSQTMRSHSIGALTPAVDTKHYLACIWDLISHYQQLKMTSPGCPLIINTPGWILGTGLEILVELITRVKPTTIIYMSEDGPYEVVSTLRDAAKSIPVITLPSQVSTYTARTAAHLRTMQYLSYFHLKPENKVRAWNGHPLTSFPPWEIRYSGENAGILGVMCYGEQPTPDLLADTINGSLVAIVVIDDISAIPGWTQTKEGVEAQELAGSNAHQYPLMEDTDVGDLDEDSSHPRQIQTPLIITTPKEKIPYFNPANSITIDPRYSHSIGLALVRGIDVARQRLQVLTPVAASVIHEVSDSGKSIVLVSGKLDTPGWAYTEELNLKASLHKASNDSTNIVLDQDGEEDEENEIRIEDTDTPMVIEDLRDPGQGFENAPWVERLQGSQGRGIGSRVWRVRRDLGKQDGGD